MAVPKKRTGKAKQASRRANWKATVPATTICKKCGEVIPTHTICPKCGYYKDEIISIKKKAANTEVVEEKKKKVTKPAEAPAEATEAVEKKPKTAKKTTAKKEDGEAKKTTAKKTTTKKTTKAPAKTKKAEKKTEE